MRVLIIHNARSGFGSDAIFEFERALVREGDECVLRVLGKDTREWEYAVLADAEQFDLVVLSGGDGTVASLLYQLRGRNILTCVFPSGTANLFFANLGNAADPYALARACRVGRSASTDLGEIHWLDEDGTDQSRGFSLMAGIGFDAQIMQAAIPAKRAMGQAAYFAAAIANLKPQIHDFTITVDGQTYERRGISCIVANNAMIQGDIELVPGCSMTDGLLDLLVVEADYTAQLVRPLFVGLVDRDGKRIDRPRLETFRGTSITVETREPAQMEVDGDPVAQGITRYSASILPNSNRLIVDALSRYAKDEDSAPLFGDTEDRAFPL
ncbi:MAG: diacylglycerol kinase family protein [Coriobacteriales bacterium]|nr:diacylglycerol kinase family protein [Coriobacteriales bacterium]